MHINNDQLSTSSLPSELIITPRYLCSFVLLLSTWNLLSKLVRSPHTCTILIVAYCWLIWLNQWFIMYTIGKPHECVEQEIVSDRVCLWGLISWECSMWDSYHMSAARVWYESPQTTRSDTISCSTHKCGFIFIIHCI